MPTCLAMLAAVSELSPVTQINFQSLPLELLDHLCRVRLHRVAHGEQAEQSFSDARPTIVAP